MNGHQLARAVVSPVLLNQQKLFYYNKISCETPVCKSGKTLNQGLGAQSHLFRLPLSP